MLSIKIWTSVYRLKMSCEFYRLVADGLADRMPVSKWWCYEMECVNVISDVKHIGAHTVKVEVDLLFKTIQ